MMKVLAFYDNWCPNCKRFSKFVRKMDWFSKVELIPVRDILNTSEYPGLDTRKALNEMAVFNGRWCYGYDSLFSIFLRLPVFWLFIPLFYLLRITKLGGILYVQLAIRRQIIPIHCTENTCEVEPKP